MEDGYNEIIKKLDRFINKYYKDLIIKGSLITLIVVLFMLLMISIVTAFTHFSTSVRAYIFFISIGIFSIMVFQFIANPLIKIIKIRKGISYKEASEIITRHFSDIKDRLINVLELKEEASKDYDNKELVLASIEEKTKKIRIFDYNLAVDFKRNFKILMYFIFLSVLSAGLVAMFPAIITEGTSHILKYEKEYINDNAIEIVILNDSLSVRKGENFTLKVNVSGIENIKQVFLSYAGNEFLMNNYFEEEYSYLFKNLNNNIKLKVRAENIESENFDISVLPGPAIIDFRIAVIPPPYTAEERSEYENIGEISVPIGSNIKWIFKTKYVDQFEFINKNNIIDLVEETDNIFKLDTILYKDFIYELAVSNKHFFRENNVSFKIDIIPDLYPEIMIEYLNDTVAETGKMFSGIIEDDYGFTTMEFIYFDYMKKDSLHRKPVLFYKNQSKQEIFYAYDLKECDIRNLGYYFEVTDNDEVNGYKSSSSRIFYFNFPDEREILNISNETYRSGEEKIKESLRITEKIKNDIEKVKQAKYNDEGNSWEIEQIVKEINSNSERLEQLVEEISNENKKNDNFLSDFTELDQEIIEKQKEIEKLLENLIDEELKNLLKEFEDLQNDKNIDRYRDIFEEMNINYEDVSDQLDKSLELLKRMEVEERLNQIEKNLDKLANEQKELGNEYDKNKLSRDSTENEQIEIQEKFEDMMDELDSTKVLNDKINNKFNIDETDENRKEINKEFENINEELEKNRKKQSSESMRKNSEEMKKMSEKIKKLRQNNNKMVDMENISNLRSTIENIIEFSFGQEDNISYGRNIFPVDPRVVEIINNQKKIEKDFIVIRDSLNALGKRTPYVGSQISDEVKKIDIGFTKVDLAFDIGNSSNASVEQQLIMTSANNLGLLLGEIVKRLKANMERGEGEDCEGQKQSGGEGVGMGEMMDSQESFKSQLEKMIEELKKNNGKQSGSSNTELGKMIARMDIMKKMLKDLMNENGMGQAAKKKLNEVRELMKKVENDLIDKNVNENTLLRQEQILSRLIEAEKAEREREIEEKRESRESLIENFSNPGESLEYKEIRKEYLDIFKKEGIKLKRYYNKRYKDYLLRIRKIGEYEKQF